MLQNKKKHWISDDAWNFNQTNIDFKNLELERTYFSKSVVLTTNIGEFNLENCDDDKAEQLIAAFSSRNLEITNIIQYEYNNWIEFIISPWTLTCTLGYVIILLFSNKSK